MNDVARQQNEMKYTVLLLFSLGFISSALLFRRSFAGDTGELGIGDPYPLAHCIVAETALDMHASVLMDGGREVRVCCPDCEDRFWGDNYVWAERIDQLIIEQQLPHYPLNQCVVDKESLEVDSVEVVFRNRLFRVCSTQCQQTLEADAGKFFGKLDEAVIKKQKATYPWNTCVVSGKPLGEHSYDHVAANLLVRLYSLEELRRFNQTPWQYLMKICEARSQTK